MNNKVVNLALLAENAGKLDKSKTNINNLFMEIKKIVDYLNADDEGDFKEKRQEFANHGVEKVGAELRKLMPWIKK